MPWEHFVTFQKLSLQISSIMNEFKRCSKGCEFGICVWINCNKNCSKTCINIGKFIILWITFLSQILMYPDFMCFLRTLSNMSYTFCTSRRKLSCSQHLFCTSAYFQSPYLQWSFDYYVCRICSLYWVHNFVDKFLDTNDCGCRSVGLWLKHAKSKIKKKHF